jgi:small subunit ribosomal protein S6
MRRLSYPIKKEVQGFYIFNDFAAQPEAVAEIERRFRIDDAVLKYLTVKISDTITNEEISAAQTEAETRRSGYEDESKTEETAAAETAKSSEASPAKPAESPESSAEEQSAQ